MKKHDTLLAVVVYCGIEKYINDYYNASNNQTDNAFDVLIINDNALIEIKQKFDYANWIDIASELTPAEIRSLIYKYAIDNKYDYLIFSDIDDYFSDNRIAVVKKYLNNYDFVCNELTIINEENIVLKEKLLTDFFLIKNIDALNLILNKNLIGLGNSAIKLDPILTIEIPKTIIAYDWFLYSILLINNCKGIFTNETTSFYRQHNSNIVGVSKQMSEKSLQLGLNVKLLHYEGLYSYCKKYQFPEESIYFEKINEMVELKSVLENKVFKEKYIKLINTNFNKIYCGWWSEILTLNQFKKYE